MPNPDNSLISFAPDHLNTEQAIKASGLSYTILRNSWYTENYFMNLPQNLATGTWYTSQGGGKLANITRGDCAAAAAAALASPPEGNVTLTLTGPESLTAEAVAGIVAKATGKPLAVVQLTDEQLSGGMRGAGLPDFLIEMLVSTEANIRAGNFDLVTDHFEQLTGRKPQTVADFFERTRQPSADSCKPVGAWCRMRMPTPLPAHVADIGAFRCVRRKLFEIGERSQPFHIPAHPPSIRGRWTLQPDAEFSRRAPAGSPPSGHVLH